MTARPTASRTLGCNGPQVSAVGVGCMGMSDLYGRADEIGSIATMHAALDAGITPHPAAQMGLLDSGKHMVRI
jgi:aryl-alcohol dehydrogenase-like predicted oxidoreductase